MAAFAELGLQPELVSAVQDMDWLLPTPIQAEAIPLILGGGDLLGAAETGSGKTGAFSLPVLQLVHETLQTQASQPASSRFGGKMQLPQCRMSSSDRTSTLAVSPDGFSCQSRSQKEWAGGRALVGCTSGKVYFEVKVTDEGLSRVGWATRSAALELGTDKGGFGFGGTGSASNAGSFTPYGQKFGLNDVIGCRLDREVGTVSFSKNGEDFGEAAKIPKGLKRQALFPAVCLKNAEVKLSFGKGGGGGGAPGFVYHPPQGFVGIADAKADLLETGEAAAESAGNLGGQQKGPSAIILEPARDLAEQVHDCIDKFRAHLAKPQLRSVLLIGGVPSNLQRRACEGGVDIVVGTPARVTDFVESGRLSLANVRFYVLDEADRLLDTGNQDAILKLFHRLPKGGDGAARLQTLMFSATLHSQEVRQLADKLCSNPLFIDLKGKDAVPDSVDHVMVHVDPRDDRSWLQSSPPVTTDGVHAVDTTGQNVDTCENWSEAVKRLKPRLLQRLVDSLHMDRCLLFVRTNFDANNLEKFLNSLGGGRKFEGRRESGKENPYSCVVLAGARSMPERRSALEAFKAGEVRFLICTDVAARGIDISGLPYVVNVTLPDSAVDYVHRTGRVGRAEALGLAVSLVAAVPEKVWYCTEKGYKPWLKPDKRNTRTNEEGGHTMWYDEPQLMKEVEASLKQPVKRLADDLSLPPEIAKRVGRSQGGGGGTYGQAPATAAAAAEVSDHQKQVRPAVATLAQLERDAQLSYFALQQRFGAPVAAGA